RNFHQYQLAMNSHALQPVRMPVRFPSETNILTDRRQVSRLEMERVSYQMHRHFESRNNSAFDEVPGKGIHSNLVVWLEFGSRLLYADFSSKFFLTVRYRPLASDTVYYRLLPSELPYTY